MEGSMRGRKWTKEEDECLYRYAYLGCNNIYIAEKLANGRTSWGVQNRRIFLGISRSAPGSMCVPEAASAMGMPEKTFYHYIKQGWVKLEHHHGRALLNGKGAFWRITYQDLVNFIQDPRSRPFWYLETIHDVVLRPYAEEAKRNAEYLTAKELSKIYKITISTVYCRCKKYKAAIRMLTYCKNPHSNNGLVIHADDFINSYPKRLTRYNR